MTYVSNQDCEIVGTGVLTRPPFLFLGCLFLAHTLKHLLPRLIELPPFLVLDPFPGHALRHSISVILTIVGVTIFVAGVRNFTCAQTPVPSTRPVQVLVTSGIHARSRNPIYVGMFLIYLGIGVHLRTPWIFILVLPLAFAIHFGTVAREEAYLKRRFGKEYLNYQSRVRRWL